MAGVYDLPGKKERMQKALADAKLRAQADMGRRRRAELSPVPDSITQQYEQDPERQNDYLAQKAWRGAGSAVLGIGDIFNTFANAGIRDVDYATGGGLSGGTYDPYQLGMTSQAAADIVHEATGQETYNPAVMPPDVRKTGGRLESLTSSVPIPGPQDFAALLPLLKATAVLTGKVSPAVLHAVPNLFKKVAEEDLAKGVDPAKVWHDWQWEQDATGKMVTETTGKPAMNPDVARPPAASGALPPRGSDFIQPEGDPLQRRLFPPQELPHIKPPNQQIPMKTDPYGPPPQFPVKHGWRGGRVSDFVTNPQLYEQPGLEFLGEAPMRLSDQPLRENPTASGLYHYPTEKKPHGEISVRSDKPYTEPSTSNIKVTSPGNPDPLVTAQHEINHLAAQHFGLPQGYSWKEPGAAAKGAEIRNRIETGNQAAEDAINKQTADYWKQEDEYFAKHGDLKSSDFDANGKVINPDYRSLSQFRQEWAQKNPELQRLIEENRDTSNLLARTDPGLAYHTRTGEVSSRNAGRRDTGEFTPQELRYRRPAETEDVPRQYQWDEDKQPGQVVNPKPEAAASGDYDPVQAARDRIQESRAKLAEQISRGYHPLSETKLRVPLNEMSSKTEPAGTLLKPATISPEDLLKNESVLVPVNFDRTAAGENLTHVNEQELPQKVRLGGGRDFGLDIEQQGPDRLVGKSGADIIESQARATREASKIGNPVLAPQNMGWRADRFSDQFTRPAVGAFTSSPMSIENRTKFDELVNATQPEGWKRWPGIEAANKSPELLNDWLFSNPGSARTMLADLLSGKAVQDQGAPDLASISRAITGKDQFELPTGMGSAFYHLDPQGKVVYDPVHKRADYPVGIQGSPFGKFETPVPTELLFPDAVAQMRQNVESRGRDPSSLTINNITTGLERGRPIQKVNEQQVENLLRWLELERKGGQ